FGEGFNLSKAKINEIMNQIFVIKSKQCRVVTGLDDVFLNKLCPNGVTECEKDKRIAVYTVYGITNIEDIKQSISKDIDDKSIEHYILRTKNKILNELDQYDRELLLKGWL
ncbi:MAG: hypothetical protein ACRCXT_07235, partial [Paraclostridium sp.]